MNNSCLIVVLPIKDIMLALFLSLSFHGMYRYMHIYTYTDIV